MNPNSILFYSAQCKVLHELVDGIYTRTECSHSDAIIKAKNYGQKLILHTGTIDVRDVISFELYDKFDRNEYITIEQMRRERWIPLD